MTQPAMSLRPYGIFVANTFHNASPPVLYEHSIANDHSAITSAGALAASSYEKTGRSPKDKRIVEGGATEDHIWWGSVNIKLPESSFDSVKQTAVNHLNNSDQLYVFDGFAGWDQNHRIKVRVICSRPYHALFMHNMLIRPTAAELQNFGEPDYVIYNAGEAEADPETPGLTSSTCVALNFAAGELVILGTQYAGEMKKGVFTIMHELMPAKGVFSMHCSANEGQSGDVSLFFGLSGTGKTTLSADAHRKLIGDDEHCWTDTGVFNIEGGCYAKCIDLSAEKEPEIFAAVKFGSVLENCVVHPETREVDYADDSLTQNTRASYPIEFIPNAKIPCVGGHPKNIILLTCDAFGVLPPISRLTPGQAMYHFISGYTAKVAGTETGVTEPEATFSACYGAAFLVRHPTVYAEMLAEKMKKHGARAWLVNTGWSGGGYGKGSRIKLQYTRAMIDAIHAGELDEVETRRDAVFGLSTPVAVPGVPSEILSPRGTWEDPAAYDASVAKLATLFNDHFASYADAASEEIRAAAPSVPATKS